MEITVRVIVDPGDGGPATSHDVVVLAREDLSVTTAGLRLDEAHQVLSGIQQHLVVAQAVAALDRAETCGDCGRRLAHKDGRTIVLRSLFGTLRISSPRFKTCGCRGGARGTFSPLAEMLPERTTPELAYWEAKYAALASYGAAADLLTDTFPLGRTLQASALRRRTTAHRRTPGGRARRRTRPASSTPAPPTGRRCPARTCPWSSAWTAATCTPRPRPPAATAGSRSSPAAPSPPATGKAKCFAYTQTYDTKPRRRLYELLKSQGMQDNQTVEFFTDGGEDVRDLPGLLNPQARHYLDWFHITMRITVLRNMTRGLPVPEPADPGDHDPPWSIDPTAVDTELERIKNYPLARQHLPRHRTARRPRRRLRLPDRTHRPAAGLRRQDSPSSPATSRPTPASSATTANATAAARPSPAPSPSPPSTRSSAPAWSRNSRCAGHPAAPTCCSNCAPASSTTTSPTTSTAGTPGSPRYRHPFPDQATSGNTIALDAANRQGITVRDSLTPRPPPTESRGLHSHGISRRPPRPRGGPEGAEAGYMACPSVVLGRPGTCRSG